MLRVCHLLFSSLALPTSSDIIAAFRVLGLDAGNPQHVTIEKVRSQYLHLARVHHPDLSSGDDQKMKVINTAYELLQGSGVLKRPPAEVGAAGDAGGGSGSAGTRFASRAKLRRRRVPDDFADGNTWSMKSTLEWDTMMNSVFGVGSISEVELKNPANHPFSHSRFFSFDEDVTIYKMIRGGATIKQVARTLGKSPTFVERRLHNAQFKQRIQYILRHEKRVEKKEKEQQGNIGCVGKRGRKTNKNTGSGGHGGNFSSMGGVNMTERVFGGLGDLQSAVWRQQHQRQGFSSDSRRKKEWEPTTTLNGEPPVYFADMTLEEKGGYDGILRKDGKEEERRGQRSAAHLSRARAASKVGRSYMNYARFSVDKANKKT